MCLHDISMHSDHLRRTAEDAVRQVVVTRIPKPGNPPCPCPDGSAIALPALSEADVNLRLGDGADSAAKAFSADAALAAGACDPDHEESFLDGARADLNVLSFSSSSSDSSYVRISPMSSPKPFPQQEERVETPASEPASPVQPTSDAKVVSSKVSSNEVTPSSAALPLLRPVTSSSRECAGVDLPALNVPASTSPTCSATAPCGVFSGSTTATPSSVAAPAQPAFAPPVMATPSTFSAVTLAPAPVSAAVSTPTPAIAQSHPHSAALTNELDLDAAIRACDDAVPALLQLWPDQDLQPLLASLRSSRDMLSSEACRASCQRAAGILQEGRLWPSSDTQGLTSLLQQASVGGAVAGPALEALDRFQGGLVSEDLQMSEECFDAAIRACDDAVPALLQLWPNQDLQPLLASLRSSRDMLSTEACRASCQRAAGILQEGRLWPSSDTQGLTLLLQMI
jgi:hypothetical protein